MNTMPPTVNQLRIVWLEILSILPDDSLRRTGLFWTEHVTTQEQTIFQNIVGNGNIENILYAVQTIHKKIIESTAVYTGKIFKDAIQLILDTKDITVLVNLSEYALDLLKGLQKFGVKKDPEGLRLEKINAPKGKIEDAQATGLTIAEIASVRSAVHEWASKTYTIKDWYGKKDVLMGPFPGTIWLAGSLLFGHSPIKGIVFHVRGKEVFWGPKISDMSGLSDVDIGMEIKGDFLKKYVPLHMVTIAPKSRIDDLTLLWSRALDKRQINERWANHTELSKRMAGLWMMKLFDRLEGIELRGIPIGTANGRPVNMRLFVDGYEEKYGYHSRLQLY